MQLCFTPILFIYHRATWHLLSFAMFPLLSRTSETYSTIDLQPTMPWKILMVYGTQSKHTILSTVKTKALNTMQILISSWHANTPYVPCVIYKMTAMKTPTGCAISLISSLTAMASTFQCFKASQNSTNTWICITFQKMMNGWTPSSSFL